MEIQASPLVARGVTSKVTRSSEARSEGGRNAADQVAEVLKCFNQRLALDNLRLVDRYVKAEISFCVKFHIRLKVTDKYVAHLERTHIVGASKECVELGEPGSSGLSVGSTAAADELAEVPRHHASQVHASGRTSNRDDDSVLVDIVQAVERPNPVTVPSLVRFDFAECFYSVSTKPLLYFSVNEGFIFLRGIADREIEVHLREVNVKLDQQQLVDQMIEGAPKILESVPGNCSNERGNPLDASIS